MVRKILIGFAIATVVILLLFWLATGGIGKVAETGKNFGNIFNLFGGNAKDFRLPWQPEGLTLGPDLSGSLFGTGSEDAQTYAEELSGAEEKYAALLKQIEEAKTLGEPSPYHGQARLSQGNATESSPKTEYVTIEASWGNTSPLSMGGWSLQSALTGVRGYIPRGAHPFLMGAVNSQSDIYLNPGASAIVSSGASPVGTSFRENMCTGYLSELQDFEPSLSRNCPSPGELFSLTPDNLKTYGDTCYDFIQTLSSCTFPRQVPANLTSACHIYLANNFSYNGCVQNYRYKSTFADDSWRIYLNAYGELWRNSHDIIRLLDAQGRTVDVITY